MNNQRISIDYCLRYVPRADVCCLIMAGWVALLPGKRLISLVDGDTPKLIEYHSWHRADVSRLLGPCINPQMRGHGFLGAVWGLRPEPVSIIEADTNEIVPLKLIDPPAINDLQIFMSELLAMPLPWTESGMAYARCIPALREATILRNNALKGFVYEMGSVGSTLINPAISIILATGCSIEFLKTQLLVLSEDQEYKKEIILVVNQSDILDDLKGLLSYIAPLINISLLWIAPRTDLTDIEAWNMGASQSKGTKLIFLNSKLIPTSSHWLREMIRPLFSGIKIVICPVAPITQQSSLIDASFTSENYARTASVTADATRFPEFPIAMNRVDFHNSGGFDSIMRSTGAALEDLRMRAGWPEPTIAHLPVAAPDVASEVIPFKRAQLWYSANLQLKWPNRGIRNVW